MIRGQRVEEKGQRFLNILRKYLLFFFFVYFLEYIKQVVAKMLKYLYKRIVNHFKRRVWNE